MQPKPIQLQSRTRPAMLGRYPRNPDMASKKSAWAAFPNPDPTFEYQGEALKKAWSALHAGDCEPYPDEKHASALIASAGKSAKGIEAKALASQLRDAWRDFHAGRFQQAWLAGSALGPLGASVAIKAIGIHASHLVDDEDERLSRYQQAVELAEKAIDVLPELANSHYRHAYALGRYSQSISIAKALKQGLAGKIRHALERTLEIAPKHAEAHTALALYHAEVIDKIGSLIGGMTYGAKASEAEKHIASAIKLTPKAPIVHIEHGNLLLLLKGSKGEDAAADAYERAANCAPRDAMETLDAAWAAEQIE
jgi:tetratricopeptide (TPR) repeat protein